MSRTEENYVSVVKATMLVMALANKGNAALRPEDWEDDISVESHDALAVPTSALLCAVGSFG